MSFMNNRRHFDVSLFTNNHETVVKSMPLGVHRFNCGLSVDIESMTVRPLSTGRYGTVLILNRSQSPLKANITAVDRLKHRLSCHLKDLMHVFFGTLYL